jgi:hypothetical protein
VEFVSGGAVTAASGAYPKMVSNALQEVFAEPTAGFCASWGDGDADATGESWSLFKPPLNCKEPVEIPVELQGAC